MRLLAFFTAVLPMMAVLPRAAAAHDIPADVLVQMFVKPQAERLYLLVRAPLGAMRDVEFPLRGPGYLDLAKADPSLRDAAILWIASGLEVYEGASLLPAPRVVAARASLPSDRSFVSYDRAFAHVTSGPLPDATALVWHQAMLDVLFEYPIAFETSAFAIRPELARLGIRVRTGVRFLPPGGAERAFELGGDPGLVRLDPRWYQATRRFVALGFTHILEGADHLLFLVCLVAPFRRVRPLVAIVTSFTVAHSLTLLASAAGAFPDSLWFAPAVEMLIAASIVYMALENIAGAGTVRRRWIIAFLFGLVHGFGFSLALRESLQFAGGHLLAALLSFNVGVELGQLAILAVLVPALGAVFTFAVRERIGTIILSALVAHTAWHWTIERADRVRQFPWPQADVPTRLSLARWLLGAALLIAAAWIAVNVRRRSLERSAL
ncbi:MAG TPA: HupE/UreJ family protein [Vicinamibacterales bacterium]|nr:HupE/UreJ family protein [Vicinamibacterales bacterium]